MMLDIAREIHEAIGIESPRLFIAAFAVSGFLIFGCLGWIIDRSYRVQHPGNTAITPPPVIAPALPQKRSIHHHKSGSATTTGANSPAITGDGNSVTYGTSGEKIR